MKKLNVGIIGHGWVATAHIQAINAGNLAQVTSVYSSRELKDEEISCEWSSEIISYTDLHKMNNKLHSEKLKSDKSKWGQLSMKMMDSGDVVDHLL